jgi:RNA polymerase sigma factor (sigma-70 family)
MNDSVRTPEPPERVEVWSGARSVGTVGSAALRRRVEADAQLQELVLTTYESHQRELYTFAFRSTRSAPSAEDVVSEAFLRFVAETRAGRVPGNPRAWLYRVAANIIVSQGRRSAVALRMRQLFVERGTATAPEAAVLEQEEVRALGTALSSLPADARVGLLLSARGFSGDEIAGILGKSSSATRTMLCRARMKLREQLTEGRA